MPRFFDGDFFRSAVCGQNLFLVTILNTQKRRCGYVNSTLPPRVIMFATPNRAVAKRKIKVRDLFRAIPHAYFGVRKNIKAN